MGDAIDFFFFKSTNLWEVSKVLMSTLPILPEAGIPWIRLPRIPAAATCPVNYSVVLNAY